MASRGCVCFVGNLPGDVREREIEDLFYKYGRIRNIDLKLPPRPPAFAFVEFENPRDAEDAVRGRDGYDFGGNSIRVELSRGGAGAGRPRRWEDDYPPRGGSRVPYGRGPPPPAPPNFRAKGSAYRVMVKGLPMSASWQDLKDHFRKVCTPNYVNVFRDRGGVIGVVEFDTPEDLARAVRKLDDTEFRNPFERAYIRVYDDSDKKGRDYSRSRSRSRSSYSRSYSRSRSPSGSRSRSRSASRSASRSRSRSASRSPSRSRSASPADDRDADDVDDKKADKDDADKAEAMDGDSPAVNGDADHKEEDD